VEAIHVVNKDSYLVSVDTSAIPWALAYIGSIPAVMKDSTWIVYADSDVRVTMTSDNDVTTQMSIGFAVRIRTDDVGSAVDARI
jgi:hypothetical protein